MSSHGGWGYEWECTPETCNEPGHPEYIERKRREGLELARTEGVHSPEFIAASDEFFRLVGHQSM